MPTFTFTVDAVDCVTCGLLIDKAVQQLPGVVRAHTSVPAGRTVVDVDDATWSARQIAHAITATGYAAHWEQP